MSRLYNVQKTDHKLISKMGIINIQKVKPDRGK